jgi:hypothetical protein
MPPPEQIHVIKKSKNIQNYNDELHAIFNE